MAILTLSEFKASGTYLLNTALFGTDAITSQLILDAEDNYLSVRGKPFKKITGDYTDTEYVISGIPDYDMIGLAKGQRIGGTSIRGEIVDVDSDNNQITLDSAATATVADDEMFVYPEQSLNVAIKIVQYLRNTASTDLSKKSESIEKHSWANWGPMDTKSGLPRNITSRIKSLAHVHEGQITGKGYYKGREEIKTGDIDMVITESEVTVTE